MPWTHQQVRRRTASVSSSGRASPASAPASWVRRWGGASGASTALMLWARTRTAPASGAEWARARGGVSAPARRAGAWAAARAGAWAGARAAASGVAGAPELGWGRCPRLAPARGAWRRLPRGAASRGASFLAGFARRCPCEVRATLSGQALRCSLCSLPAKGSYVRVHSTTGDRLSRGPEESPAEASAPAPAPVHSCVAAAAARRRSNCLLNCLRRRHEATPSWGHVLERWNFKSGL